MANTGPLELCVPCPLDDIRIINGIQDLLSDPDRVALDNDNRILLCLHIPVQEEQEEENAKRAVHDGLFCGKNNCFSRESVTFAAIKKVQYHEKV